MPKKTKNKNNKPGKEVRTLKRGAMLMKVEDDELMKLHGGRKLATQIDYKSINLDENEINKIFQKKRCDRCIVKLPPLNIPVPEARYKVIKDFFDAAFSQADSGMPLSIEPPNEGIASAKRKSTKTNKKYDYSIRSLSRIINDQNISDEFRQKCSEERNRIAALREGEEISKGYKFPGKSLKINQVRDQQIYDLCLYVWDNAKIPEPKKQIDCFNIVAKIWNAKRKGNINSKDVKTIYNNICPRKNRYPLSYQK